MIRHPAVEAVERLARSHEDQTRMLLVILIHQFGGRLEITDKVMGETDLAGKILVVRRPRGPAGEDPHKTAFEVVER